MPRHIETLDAGQTAAAVRPPNTEVVPFAGERTLGWSLVFFTATDVVALDSGYVGRGRAALFEVLEAALAQLRSYCTAEHENGYHRDTPEPGCPHCTTPAEAEGPPDACYPINDAVTVHAWPVSDPPYGTPCRCGVATRRAPRWMPGLHRHLIAPMTNLQLPVTHTHDGLPEHTHTA